MNIIHNSVAMQHFVSKPLTFVTFLQRAAPHALY